MPAKFRSSGIKRRVLRTVFAHWPALGRRGSLAPIAGIAKIPIDRALGNLGNHGQAPFELRVHDSERYVVNEILRQQRKGSWLFWCPESLQDPTKETDLLWELVFYPRPLSVDVPNAP